MFVGNKGKFWFGDCDTVFSILAVSQGTAFYMEKQTEIYEACCFIGHRKLDVTDELRQRLYDLIIDLVQNHGTRRFLFGSKSQFDSLCHEVVTQLQQTAYPDIVREAYPCRSEGVILKPDKDRYERILSRVMKKAVTVADYDKNVEFPTKYTAGLASYVERNQAMIDDSNICVFYCNPDYQPPLRKRSKQSLFCYQPNSGTQISYRYAITKKKKIVDDF